MSLGSPSTKLQNLVVTLNDNSRRIIGNIYRPNTAPKGNLSRATEIHLNIIDQIKTDKRLKGVKIVLVSDFNANLLNFSTHNETGLYVDQQMTRGLLPMITKPTRLYHNSATLIDNIFVSPVKNPVCSRRFSLLSFKNAALWVLHFSAFANVK